MRFKSLREAYNRDRQLILSVPLSGIQKALGITIASFSVLNILDIVTTLYNLNYVDGAFEANRFAGLLLRGGPLTALAAVLVKFEIIAILLLIYFLVGRFSLAIRVVKIGTIAGLLAVTPLYVWGVVINNLAILVQSLLA